MTVIIPPLTSKTDDFTTGGVAQNGLTRAGFTWALGNGTVNPGINTLDQAAMRNTTVGIYPALFTGYPVMTDTHFASAFNIGALNAGIAGLIVGANSGFTSYIVAKITSSNVIIAKGSSGTGTTTDLAAKGSAPTSTATNQAWRLDKLVANNGALYRVWCGSTLQVSYLDTTLQVPNGAANRYCGIMVQRTTGPVNSAGWDAFTAADLRV